MNDLQSICFSIENKLNNLFTITQDAREDSRAFGAMIQKKIEDSWESVCVSTNNKSKPKPGKKCIYDVALVHNNTIFGVDVSTKDLDEEKYSDGGISSVGSMCRFLGNKKSIFLIAQVGHVGVGQNSDSRSLKYIRVVPCHCLPKEIFEIQNLGLGQVRLNNRIDTIYGEINWDRSVSEFLDMFIVLAEKHYRHVAEVAANSRINNLIEFKKSGYTKFVAKREAKIVEIDEEIDDE